MKPVQLIISLTFAWGIMLSTLGTAFAMDKVLLETRSGNHIWQVELASDNETRARGLMFRESMAAKTGMLFRFQSTGPVAMWMKNTLIPLDMIFANEAGQVTHIHKGAVPHSLDVISSNGPVRYVLEVNAGEADQFGIAVGDQMKHPWILPAN